MTTLQQQETSNSISEVSPTSSNTTAKEIIAPPATEVLSSQSSSAPASPPTIAVPIPPSAVSPSPVNSKSSKVIVPPVASSEESNLPSSPDAVVANDEARSPSSPSSPKDNSPNSTGVDKDTKKLASKAFGYIQRSIELLGKESTRLAGARDFSNTLHWTQAMKFLKERGFIYTKTGHGTSVAEQFTTLEGLEKAFQEQFALENFPLPRLSKTHLEKTMPAQFDPYAQYRMHPGYPMMPYGNFIFVPADQKGMIPQGSIPYFVPNMMQPPAIPRYEAASNQRRVSAPEVVPTGLQALSAAAQSEFRSEPTRRSSVPEYPLPSIGGMYPMPAMDQYANQRNEHFPSSYPQMPSYAPDDRQKPSNIHNILHAPNHHQPMEPIEPAAHGSSDALLFQNFCNQLNGGDSNDSKKRNISLPPVSDLAQYSTSNESAKKQRLIFEQQHPQFQQHSS